MDATSVTEIARKYAHREGIEIQDVDSVNRVDEIPTLGGPGWIVRFTLGGDSDPDTVDSVTTVCVLVDDTTHDTQILAGL